MLIPIFILLIIALLLFLFYASYSIQSGVYINALCKANRKENVVALTFDDGPDSIQTEKVLDILKEYNVKACFFCIGRNIDGNEKLLVRMKDEGHLIGNHSFSHIFSFPLQPAQRLKDDLEACDNQIKKITQEDVTLFRPPFGVTNPLIAKAVKQMKYITIGWNIRSLDTCKSVEKALNRIKKRLKPGAIILLHDPLPESDILLRQLLDYLEDMNYKTERIDSLLDLKTE